MIGDFEATPGPSTAGQPGEDVEALAALRDELFQEEVASTTEEFRVVGDHGSSYQGANRYWFESQVYSTRELAEEARASYVDSEDLIIEVRAATRTESLTEWVRS